MSERFELETKPHGAGGFGKVLKGVDKYLERNVAVKVLDPLATTFGKEERERFRREARILAKLSHPNIPSIFDVVFSDKDFSIIFQFVEGRTLKQLIDEEGPCQLGEAQTWFSQVASALEHAHSMGVIHRDVKPENLIITPNRDTAYLVDFGIALSEEEAKKLTESGYVVGTRGYMSPEQEGGEKLDHRADIYSLGVTLYEALAGKRIPVGHYEELAALNEAIAPEVDALILDCLKPLEDRLNSLKAFVARLRGALRPTRPLSEVLAHGRLHELAASIEALNEREFAQLPMGQRVLILTKLADITASGDPKLGAASEQLLVLLLTRGVLLDAAEYREIVQPAIQWGFALPSYGTIGREPVRRAFEEAAFEARDDAHTVLSEELVAFVETAELDSKEDWYLHGVRAALQTLLANPSCKGLASRLAAQLKRVNKLQRSKPPRGSQPARAPLRAQSRE